MAVLALAGCGAGGDAAPDSSATLLLDGRPSAVDAGIELAVQRGFTDAEGVDLTVQTRAGERPPDFMLMDLDRLLAARRRGRDLVAVMAIVQRRGPLLVVTRETLQDDADLVRATVHALQRGYRAAILDPESAVAALLQAAPRTNRARAVARLEDLAPSLRATDGSIGTFDAATLAREPRAFDPSFARSGVKSAAEDSGS